jgi:hypothetical protein
MIKYLRKKKETAKNGLKKKRACRQRIINNEQLYESI